MGQYEILEFLKKHPGRWFITKDIAKSLRVSIGSVTAGLKRLRKSKFVEFMSAGGNIIKYRFKR